MDFEAFDTKKIEEYKKQAKEQWGKTAAYKEDEQKDKNRSKAEQSVINNGLMKLLAEFGKMISELPESDKIQKKIEELQNYITVNFYTCTKEILSGLGKMYAAEGEFKENIDKAGGNGCAEFISKAIEIYCR